MATQGPKKSKHKKSQVITSNALTIALDVSNTYLGTPLVSAYGKLSSLLSSFTDAMSNTFAINHIFNSLRSKKRTAEEAIPSASDQNLTVILVEATEEKLQRELKTIRRNLAKEYEQDALANSEFLLVEEAVAQYRPGNPTADSTSAAEPVVPTETIILPAPDASAKATAQSEPVASPEVAVQPEPVPHRVNFIPNALDSANGQRLQEAHAILKDANVKAPNRRDGETPLARYHAKRAKMK